jgi:hypothetical protein
LVVICLTVSDDVSSITIQLLLSFSRGAKLK